MSSRGNSSPSPPLMSESARKVHVGGDAAATGFGAAGASSSMPLRSAASASRISRTSSREWFRAAPRSAGVSSNAAGVVSARSTEAPGGRRARERGQRPHGKRRLGGAHPYA